MLDQFFNINTVIGINLTMLNHGELSVSACQIVKHKKQLDFEQKAVSLTSLKELTDKFNIKIPVALNLSGKGILTKVIEKIADLSPGQFFTGFT